jgi:hypothetical protein
MFPALSPGDYNADGLVDVADYGQWRSTFGSATRLAADGNKNGLVDGADYVLWRDAIDTEVGKIAAGIPEPTSGRLFAALWGAFLLANRNVKLGR